MYHIMYVYLACVPECCGSVFCASQLGSTTNGTITSNSDESKKLSDDDKPQPKHIGVCILNKGVVNSVHVLVVFTTSYSSFVFRLLYVIIREPSFMCPAELH
jgi:hypothetical protein